MIAITYETDVIDYSAFEAFVAEKIGQIEKTVETKTIYIDSECDADAIKQYSKQMMLGVEIKHNA